MLSFTQFINLQEKLIVPGKNQKYGQVIFFGGGAASGKGFAISNFIDTNKFKVVDVDRMKDLYIELEKKKNPSGEIANINLKNPEDVGRLHQIIKDKGFDKKIVDNLFINTNKDRLPNIIFDVTMKDDSKIKEYIPMLLSKGYLKENIHLIWVLTSFETAKINNSKRGRVVPDKPFKATHEGAKNTLESIMTGKRVISGLDGDFFVILNNRENTEISSRPDSDVEKKLAIPKLKFKSANYIKNFVYMKVKEAGKSVSITKETSDILGRWILQNAPK